MGFQLPELPRLVSETAGFLVAFDQRNASGAQQGMNLIMAPKDGTYPAPHGGGKSGFRGARPSRSVVRPQIDPG